MRLNQVFKAGALVAGLGAAFGSAARAADMPLYDSPAPSYDEPQQPLQFGSGWYLRGDAAYTQGDHPKFDAALGSFNRNATSGGYAFGLGAGYKFTSFLRFDLTSDFVQPFDYSGQTTCGVGCTVNATDHVWRWDGLANAYIDLGTWYGITPYVGGGAGIAGTRQDLQQVTTTALGVSSTSPASGNQWQFAWAGMAGFSYAFAPHMLVDLGYRYIDYGRTTIQLSPVATTQKDLTAHQVRIGLRYMID